MNPLALCRWIGSELPGGYSTTIINPSLPGPSLSSFDKRGVTLSSSATAVSTARLSRTNHSILLFISEPLFYPLCNGASIRRSVPAGGRWPGKSAIFRRLRPDREGENTLFRGDREA